MNHGPDQEKRAKNPEYAGGVSTDGDAVDEMTHRKAPTALVPTFAHGFHGVGAHPVFQVLSTEIRRHGDNQ